VLECRKINFRQIASENDCFVFDCDGVVWTADKQIDEAFKTIEWLEAQGKDVFFVTNGALKTVDDLKAKMQKMGYQDPQTARIFGTARIMGSYIKV
jgi:4-nitrophenyl phosphatase